MDHNCDDGDFPKKYGCFSLRRFLVGGIIYWNFFTGGGGVFLGFQSLP